MPIRPENKARYPKNWKEISRHIRVDRSGGRCECLGECGLSHDGGRCEARNYCRHPHTDSPVVLTVAHLDHIPENCKDDNLKAMCQQCHNKYDAPMRRKGIKERAKKLKAIGEFI